MKIKSVDIVGFRAYAHPGDGFFDFTNENGEVSNFISIYAPNGFGKSSFYDAMEWAITNNISRFTRDSQRNINHSTSLYLNNSDSTQRILKNRYIDEDAPSYVAVVTNKGNGIKTYRRPVRRPALGQRDYTYDPARTDQTTKHLTDIFLSQDAIDAFLKEERPEQRYDRFMVDFGGAEEKYRSALFASIKASNKEIKFLNDAIKSLENDLEDPLLEFSIDKVNDIIDEINAAGSNFPKIDSTFSELKQAELRSMLVKRIIELENENASLKDKVKSIDLCIENLPRLEKLKNSRAKLLSDIENLRTNRRYLDELGKFKSNLIDIDNRLLQLLEEIKNIDKVINSYEEITKISEEILNGEARIKSIDSQLDIETASLKSHSLSIESIKQRRIELDIKLAGLLDSNKKTKSHYAEINILQSFISEIQSKIFDSERRLSIASALKHSLSNEFEKYSNLSLDKKAISDEEQSLLKPDPDFIINYHQYLKSKDDITIEIRRLDETAKDLDFKSSHLFELLDVVKSIIESSNTSNCPVCSARYESQAELLEKIHSNDSLNVALRSILNQKNVLEKRILEIDAFLDKGLEYLLSLKASIISDISKKISDNDEGIQKLTIELTSQNNELLLKADSLHKLQGAVRNLSESDYISYLNEELNSVNKEILSDNLILESEQKMISTSERNVSTYKIEKSNLLLHIESLKNTELYNIFVIQKEKYLLADIDTYKAFSIKYKELTELKDFINNEKLQTTNNIKHLEAKVYNDSLYSSESVVQEKLFSLTTELEQAQEYISRLESDTRLFVTDINDSNVEINKNLVKNRKANNAKHIEIEYILMRMNILAAQVDKALPFFKYIEKREEVNALLEKVDKIQRLVLSLDGELRAVEIKLKSRINNFFYTDLITSIYQKIDPHPFFKTVSFECVFPDDERPRLEVYLYEENSLQPISPALYFSSAQLNILSLSIFLAKALHIEHEGLPVKTILIDDPIHSMDSINVLSVIDLLRNISINFDRQIVLSTHDENFYELLKLKIPEDKFGSKFIRFKSFGIVHNDKRSID